MGSEVYDSNIVWATSGLVVEVLVFVVVANMICLAICEGCNVKICGGT